MALCLAFDEISVYQPCPFCKLWQGFDAQTYDLGSRMYNYHSLSKHWFEPNMLQKDFRKRIKVFPHFPLDKSHKVWKSQAEQAEAEATVPKEFQKLKFVEVVASCHSKVCQNWADRNDLRLWGYISGFGRRFDGKIQIKNGKLFGNIYDIKLIDRKFKPAVYKLCITAKRRPLIFDG